MILVYATLVLLTLAVSVLAAMIGELGIRLQEQVSRNPSSMEPLTQAAVGARVTSFPGGKEAPSSDYQLVILSSTCRTCSEVARELTANRGTLPDVFLVVSAPTAEHAGQFIDDTGIAVLKPLIDGGGAWVRQTLNIDVSPALVNVLGGTIVNANTFERFDQIQLLDALEPNGRIGSV